jgi:hypothetical protein
VEVRRGFVRFVPCHEGPFPLLGIVVVSRHPQKALYALSPVFTGLVPSGLTPSSVLKCGLINHRDGVTTYVPRAGAREYDYAREGLKPAC